jgi:hypothetical protein
MSIFELTLIVSSGHSNDRIDEFISEDPACVNVSKSRLLGKTLPKRQKLIVSKGNNVFVLLAFHSLNLLSFDSRSKSFVWIMSIFVLTLNKGSSTYNEGNVIRILTVLTCDHTHNVIARLIEDHMITLRGFGPVSKM